MEEKSGFGSVVKYTVKGKDCSGPFEV